MVQKRSLPKKGNPLLSATKVTSYEDLIDRRRLGQTKLEVKQAQIGISNATLPSNLGVFEYAHLRAPLPADLSAQNSGVFKDPIPDSYFLMRRSKDGYISATGMFKAAFPYASGGDEELERKYILDMPATSHDETAGNVWIPEKFALDLAEEYNIGIWIKALLDPTPIDSKGASSGPKKSISPPPKFTLPKAYALHPPEPVQSTPSRRGRPRADSPGKQSSPGKKGTSTRKPRVTKAANVANANAASDSLQQALNSAAIAAESEASTNGDKVTVEVDSGIDMNGNVETDHTNVKVEVPGNAPDLALPENPETVIAKAKEMVQEARRLEGSSSSKATKRKADQLDKDEDGEQEPSKKIKTMEEELKKERIKTRALLGLSATLAIG
ncbi:MAG: hypothetical protein M1837_003100 [Sclerophora amabilis]|nr:MAG: hypothetical protein M1837_003100 [Sclerophora amabilis]